jgi:hypothetical protein
LSLEDQAGRVLTLRQDERTAVNSAAVDTRAVAAVDVVTVSIVEDWNRASRAGRLRV